VKGSETYSVTSNAVWHSQRRNS